MKPRILVTTGAGRTGSVAALELVRQGFPVRCLVHRDDDRAALLRKAGIEVVVGSLYDWRDVSTALCDVQRAYHCPPFDSRHLHGATMFALAAEQAGVEVVALMSGWNPHPSHPSILQREHWLANNLYRRQGNGHYRQLLRDVTRDPAMLIYLDNRQNKSGKAQENYAREILELFTMGVGNYSEQDVREIARAFTGETINNNCKENWL